MRKVIAVMNMSLDAYCDHTLGVADGETHQHYAEVLRQAGAVLYGRITYGLMEYWRTIVEKPTGEKSTDEFAAIMDKVPKVVFSRTLETLDWESARLATRSLEDEIAALKQAAGKDIYIGSPGLIAQATNLDLIDEFQICIHPVIAGSGLVLFKNISENKILELVKTKTFGCGAVVMYYASAKNKE